ncbi:Release factor glutamine methyltransferase [Desulfovibrionales bacterium]
MSPSRNVGHFIPPATVLIDEPTVDLTVSNLLIALRAKLVAANVDSPALSARLLVAYGLGMDALELVICPDRKLTMEEYWRIWELAVRRGRGEPIAYLLEEKEFYGLPFTCSPVALVPRPETESLVDEARRRFSADVPLCFADLGTGSGILAVTLAYLFPRSLGLALDTSPEALALAQSNARRHGVVGRIVFLRADFSRPFCRPGLLDIVMANPPYMSSIAYVNLSHEILYFEPRQALVSGPTGLEAYAALLPWACAALRPSGTLLLEIGWDQGEVLRQLLSGYEVAGRSVLSRVTIHKDLAGYDRIAVAERAMLM